MQRKALLHTVSMLLMLASASALATPVTQSEHDKALEQAQVADMLAHLPSDFIANILNWVPSQGHTLCEGYFAQPKQILAYPHPGPIGSAVTHIGAHAGSFAQNGTSILVGNIDVTQPGREIKADKAYIYRDKETGHITHVTLKGDVRMSEANKLVTGRQANLNFLKGTATIKQSIYRTTQPSLQGNLNAWGTANYAKRESADVLNLYNATYTTCSPLQSAWHLRAKHIRLDKTAGRGTATGIRLYAKNVPIFYLPYLNFPINKERKSGFLYPTVGLTSNNGLDISIPYYLNLAPNYDATLTPRILSKRGVQLNGLYRYLTLDSNGFLQLGYLPNDKEFEKFKAQAPNQYTDSYYQPFLDRLKNYSNNRGMFAFSDNTRLNQKWSTDLNLNYVTDPYYFQDLGSNPLFINNDQLLNQADLNYQGEHWQFLGRVQAYQTLHQVNQAFILDQYQRLPQLDLNANYPNQAYGLDYALNSEFTYFDHARDFFTGAPFPTGDRLHMAPSISRPWVGAAGYIEPSLQLDMTDYALKNNSPPTLANQTTGFGWNSPAAPNNMTRVLPIFDVDSKLYFERNLSLFRHKYRQTLEPRVFYLFVPRTNQANIPLFDTISPPFDFNTLFRTNRFIGIDRVGDANQVAVGITSRLLDQYTGADKVDVSVGEIYYLQKHKICLYADCSDDPTVNDSISPIAGQLTYHLTPHWSAIGSIAWDPNLHRTNNGGAHIQYMPAPNHVINVGYDYVQGGDVIDPTQPQSSVNNLHRVDLSTAWPLSQRWSVLADWNYNISHHHPQTYLYGLQYDTCCWAVRLLSSRILANENINGGVGFQTAYYIQFLLKGLGNIGNSDPGNLLMTTIPSYVDNFRG